MAFISIATVTILVDFCLKSPIGDLRPTLCNSFFFHFIRQLSSNLIGQHIQEDGLQYFGSWAVLVRQSICTVNKVYTNLSNMSDDDDE